MTHIFWADSVAKAIYRMDADGSDVTTVVSAPTEGQIPDFCLDPVGEKLYWVSKSGTENSKVFKADLDGANQEQITAIDLAHPIVIMDIDVDPVNERLYFLTMNEGYLRSSGLDGSDITELVTSGISTPGDLEVDPDGGKVYFSSQSFDTVKRVDLDGTNEETIVSSGLNNPYGLAVDTGILYIADYQATDGDIFTIGADGSGTLTSILTRSGLEDVAVDTVGDHLYFVDIGTDDVTRSDLDGGDVTTVYAGSGYPVAIELLY